MAKPSGGEPAVASQVGEVPAAAGAQLDVSDDAWAPVVPYLTLVREDALREVFNALRWMARAGASWRMLPNDLPPWELVYQQSQR